MFFIRPLKKWAYGTKTSKIWWNAHMYDTPTHQWSIHKWGTKQPLEFQSLDLSRSLTFTVTVTVTVDGWGLFHWHRKGFVLQSLTATLDVCSNHLTATLPRLGPEIVSALTLTHTLTLNLKDRNLSRFNHNLNVLVHYKVQNDMF